MKCKHVFIVPLKSLAQKGLTYHLQNASHFTILDVCNKSQSCLYIDLNKKNIQGAFH